MASSMNVRHHHITTIIFLIIGISILLMDSKLYHSNTFQMHTQLSKSLDPFVRVTGNKFYLYDKPFIPKILCYYPRDYGWSKMLDNFWQIQDIIREDMARAKNISANIIRVPLVYGSLNGSSPNEWDLKKLDRLLEIMDEYNLKALFTLFDWVDPRTAYLSDHLQHVRTIVNRFRDDPRVFGWDLKWDLDCWVFYHNIPKSEILQWARTIINEIKSIDSNHSVCVSEYGFFLGDIHSVAATTVYDDFEDGNYFGWAVLSGDWTARDYYLLTCGDDYSYIYHTNNNWWNNRGFTIKIKTWTNVYGALNRLHTGWIYFRFDPSTFPLLDTYAVGLTLDRYVELWKCVDGNWQMLSSKYTGLDPTIPHQFTIVHFGYETEIYVDNVKYIYYWDYNPLTYGGLALGGPPYYYAEACFDDIEVIIGPSIIDENIQKYCDFILLNTGWDSSEILSRRINTVRVMNKPVVLLMYRPTRGLDDNGNPIPFDENSVATWLAECLQEIKKHDFVFPGIAWLYDFSLDGCWFKPPENHLHYYGLYRLDYTTKPHAIIFREYYQGTTIYNDAEILSATHPSIVECGSSYTVSITVVNKGNTYWSYERNYKLGSHEPTDNTIWGIQRISLGSNIIHPSQNHTFIFSITSPAVPGKYSFSWRMVRDNVEWFGNIYRNAIKVKDPRYLEKIDDEFDSMNNWTLFTGISNIYNSHLELQPNSCAINLNKYYDIAISYRGYSPSISGWQKGITFVKIFKNFSNYLGFTLYANGYAEIFYVHNGTLYSNISGTQTNILPTDYHTYFIIIEDRTMIVYIDGVQILSADISSYPYYANIHYVGFYSQSSTSYIDHCAIYFLPAMEIDSPLVFSLIIMLIMPMLIIRARRRLLCL